MKLNIGCGLNKADGFVNIDKYATAEPDMVMDAEAMPWPFEDNSVDEVLFNHSLEHMGADTEVFLGIIKELYRVCKGGATVRINVPHPRHDNFIDDPTHVRVITAGVLNLFSKANCRMYAQHGWANSPMALYIDVDFEVRSAELVLEDVYVKAMAAGTLSREQMMEIVRTQNNVVSEMRMQLEVIKP